MPETDKDQAASQTSSTGSSDDSAGPIGANVLGDMAQLFLARASLSAQPKEPSATAPPPANLHMAEARYRTLIELLPAVTFLATFEQGFSDLYVSPQIEALLGYTQNEWIEDPVLWYQRLHPEDRERWNTEFARTVAAGEPLKSVYRFIARNGRIVWIHCEARIVRDDRNRPSFIHGIGVDVSPIKLAEQRVIEYSQKLEETNKELEKFAYVASHDLQEPLRSILAYSSVLREESSQNLNSEAQGHLERIVNAGQRMKRLIQALLEFSRVGRDNLPFTPTDFNLAVREAIGNLQSAADENQAAIMVEPLPTIAAIRPYITTLFQNLIGNALKYRSERTPHITISGVRGNDSWVFSVRDNGIGIAPHHQQRIFEIFQRLQPEAKIPGTGIGLAICKKVLDLHGGRIWVESEAGKGSIFKFAIPAQPLNPKT